MGGNCSEDAAASQVRQPTQKDRHSSRFAAHFRRDRSATGGHPRTTSGEFTMTASKNPKPGNSGEQRPERESTGLDARYGEIGILAVAAALPYAGGKSPAPTEPEVRIDQRFIEVAA